MHPNPNASELVLEQLPNGEAAWLRPERRYVLPSRYQLTERAHRLLTLERLLMPFDQARSVAMTADRPPARCPACQQPQDSAGCAAREHWGVA
jgi:hypothetical protein